MLKEMPLLRAPEKRRTGMEIKPKVRYPDQTEAAIVHPVSKRRETRASVLKFNLRRDFDAVQVVTGTQISKHNGWDGSWQSAISCMQAQPAARTL
jgi:hypothetical protein